MAVKSSVRVFFDYQMPYPAKLAFLWLAVWLLPMSGVRAAGWELVWSDEFNYTGLPDPGKWDYEDGYLRNDEAQFYTRARRENARVENGMLILEARKEHFRIPAGSRYTRGREFADYTSASLTTRGKQNWTYGRLEMRAKLPQGKGVWPAFWTLGENVDTVGWTACGEIDIMEFVGHDPNLIYGTSHYRADGRDASDGSHVTTELTHGNFHVYAVEWDHEKIDFFVDDHLYHTTKLSDAGAGTDNPFRRPQYLLLNFALGGSWGGPIDDSILPQRYLIDYVRVFRRKE